MIMETKIRNKNSIYQKFEVLKTNRNKRHRYHEFLVEGVRSLNEIVANGWRIKSFLYDSMALSDWAKDMIRKNPTNENYCLTSQLLKELSGKTDGSELMAIVEMRDNNIKDVVLSNNPFIVLFDTPSNKGNLGTIIRSCDAFGVDTLIITGHSVDIYDPEVIVSSMGSFFNMSVVRMENNAELFNYFDSLKKCYSNIKFIGTTAHKEKPIYLESMKCPVVIMIGNETQGLNRTLKNYCDCFCSIPMATKSYASSLNVGCAASVLMYEVNRQRTNGTYEIP